MPLLILCGPGAGGKTFARERLLEFGFKSVVSTTTRTPRQGEENGVHYWFITHEQFASLEAEQAFHEVATFDQQRYGVQKAHMVGKNGVAILTPSGIAQIKEEKIVIYLDIAEDVRRGRLLQRGMSPEAVDKRIESDHEQFRQFKEFDHICTDPTFTFTMSGHMLHLNGVFIANYEYSQKELQAYQASEAESYRNLMRAWTENRPLAVGDIHPSTGGRIITIHPNGGCDILLG
jgi:guanylate kinase